MTRLALRVAVCIAMPLGSPAALRAQQEPAGHDPARVFFARPAVTEVRIALTPEGRQRLRDQPREYVRATLQFDAGERVLDAAVKLKGAAGSFREVDDQPGFTVHLGRFGGTTRLHGLKRFHLNNCVQDDSRLCEWLGGEVFTQAGYPAPRVSHARVWLDDHELGLYVLREGYDRQFLRRVFGDAHGNLYDGGFCRDLEEELEKDEGDGPDDRSDLQALAAACREFDPLQPEPLMARVDVDAFVDFMALEALIGHWDGYCQNSNNFRLWCDRDSRRTRFLPHGMDQIFGDPEASVLDHPPSLLASAVSQRPAWRKQYRRRLVELLPLLAPDRLRPRAEQRLTAMLQALPADDARREDLQRACDELFERIEQRHRFLVRHVRQPDPKPLEFRGSAPIVLTKWNAAAETSGITLQRRSHQGEPSLHLAIDGVAVDGAAERHGAFRCVVLLARGRYRVSGIARCAGVVGLGGGDDDGGGVRLRADGDRSEALLDDRRWTRLECEFEVGEFQRQVELRLELAGTAGKAWFRSDSLRLVRLAEDG